MSASNFRKNKTATIPGGGSSSLSGAVQILNTALVALVTPSAWTAAGIGFHVSYDDGDTYVQLAGLDMSSAPHPANEYEIAAGNIPTAEAYLIALDPAMFLGATHVKVRSQTAGVAVNQAAERAITLITRDMGV